MSTPFDTLIDNLDLTSHIHSFESFFSREKALFIEGDQELHYKYITALDELAFKAPPKIEPFSSIQNHLKKQGVLRFEQIFELIKLVRYFRRLKNSKFEGLVGVWLDKITIPEAFDELDTYFNEEGRFNESMDESIYGLTQRINVLKDEMNASMKRLIFSKKLASYLVDTQIHYLHEEEALLVRGGFNHVLKGSMIGRSSGGFFYVVPDSVVKFKEQIRAVNQQKEMEFYEYAKRFSQTLKEQLLFIKFIDKEFDRFDHYQARVHFARSKNLAMMKTVRERTLNIDGFEHPALHKPKPVSVDFSKNVLMITGVNAGGKTMLLKSILSAAVMAKYLIPMQINKHKSRIGSFKRFEAVIDDPQNVSNDISTFAGRMQQFARLFSQNDALIGVDEIELGTDSDEAAALFKVILDDLIVRGQKIIVTTHHKRLAALMADRDDVELMAAVYDEENRAPTYEFLQGIIGKSYAFETALRYGISNAVVKRAKEVYGDNSEKLNQLIERGSELERSLKRKNSELDERLNALKEEQRLLKEAKDKVYGDLKSYQDGLDRAYAKAIDVARAAAKEGDSASIHRKMNEANKNLPKKPVEPQEVRNFVVGESVKYRTQRGTIISLKAKEAMIEVEGMRMRVKRKDLKHATPLPKVKPRTQVNTQVEKRSGLKLDLHGLRAVEAEEKLDKFISDALLQGWDEVLIYHGIGTGKLSYAVKEFLKAHPSVKGFSDAPQHMGGFGAKVVSL
ncbi:MAG: endonuclease MutS2 [Campylobacterota bacterium]|nr:endonuclease MutS2 [Campylobacterota bacterium]